jgi:hypothetical protein
MYYLRYLCLLVCSGVQHIVCCGFALFFLFRLLLPVSLDFFFFYYFPTVFSNFFFEEQRPINDTFCTSNIINIF